jgi:endogenous inhibitor of DNA gyrase (YacG/DUF329 family)
MIRTCEICGKEFTRNPASVNKGHGRFCSKRCSGISQRKDKVSVSCVNCGNDFLVHPYRAETARFCSVECHGQWESREKRGTKSQNWKGKVEKTCEYCGKKYLEYPYFESRRFCSMKCKGKWQSVAYAGENSHLWRGGKSDYPDTFDATFKQMIRKRDNGQCAICEKRAKCVHHINYIKDDTTPSNCITLCTSCHGRTNFHRPYWQGYFTELMETRGFV